MARRRDAGFTLMEILISMTILMLGLLPMMAVFQTAMMSLNRAVEDTYASAIAQSVIDSIRLGLKDMKVEYPDGTKLFILDHEGWTTTRSDDEDPRSQLERDRAGQGPIRIGEIDIALEQHKAALMQRDYTIVLPKDTETDTTGKPAAFLYPRKEASGARPQPARYVSQTIRGPDGRDVTASKLRIEKVYQLGKKLTKSQHEVEQHDAFSQYSFAFTIRPAKGADPLNPTAPPKAIEGLYEVVVRVFRNFNPDPGSRRNDPVGGVGREFITYVKG